jgi:dihydrofolate synthase/folylpolyglutamate synthase
MRPGAHRLQHFVAETMGAAALEAPVILVTGTNGKGTVSALLESIFRACGERTGLYTSPHLVRVEERIRVSGVPIPSHRFSQICSHFEGRARDLLPDLSSYELLTAAALHHFREERVTISIFEIGLGGRLDSTNALVPTVSVLTSVALDHAEILGSTFEEIAYDKAHISRRNRPLVVGPLCEAAQRGVVRAVAKTGARLVECGWPPDSDFEVVFARIEADGTPWLKANRSNIRIALGVVCAWERETGRTLCRSAIVEGVCGTFWPGRLDARRVEGLPIVFDAAHNPAGLAFLEAQLAELAGGRRFGVVLYSSLSDKKWDEILPKIAGMTDAILLTELPGERRVPVDRLASALPPELRARALLEPDLRAAVGHLMTFRGVGPILVTGSIALLGEVMEILGLDPLEPKSRISSWSELF